MDTTLFLIGLIGFAIVALLVVLVVRSNRGGADAAMASAVQRLSETADKLAVNQNVLADRVNQTQASVNERLDAMQKRLGDGLAEHTEKTGKTLKELHERLAVINEAQKNITDLSQQMVGLQDILSNKQARGAFGEIQLNDLVTAVLPPSAYAFQKTLSNGSRADCLLLLPNPPGPIVIDAKFPLESYAALRDAADETAKVQASRQFSADVRTHVAAIADKYVVPGETAESALMFLPSEAIYAELHANFRNVVEESFRRRVWIVSPTTLMATLNTVRAVLKDARMREQAGLIQTEVLKLMEDVARLDTRVESLRKHFGQAEKDIEQIETSTRKISSRGDRIESVQLGDEGTEGNAADDLDPPPVAPERQLGP